MQKNEFSPDFQTSNPFSEHFQKFGNTRLFDRLQSKFTPKPYYYQYRRAGFSMMLCNATTSSEATTRFYLEQPDCEGGTFIYQSREEAEIFQRHLEKCCAGTNPERCFCYLQQEP